MPDATPYAMNPVTPPRGGAGSARPWGGPAAIAALILALLAFFCAGALAQDDGQRQAMINGWRATLAQTEAALQREGLTTKELDAKRDEVLGVATAARAFKAEIEPRLNDLDAQLNAIAPPPPAGETAPPLPPATQQIYDQLNAQFEDLSALAAQTTVIILQAGQMLEEIAKRRDAFFTARMFERGPSVVSPALWRDTVAGFPTLANGLGRVLSAWFGRIAASDGSATLLLLLAAATGVAIVAFVRFLFTRWAQAWTAAQSPTPERKVLMATAVVVADIAVPMLILYGLRATFAALGLLPPAIGILFDGVIVAAAVFAVITGMARALAAPNQPEWRIGGIADETARSAYRVVAFAAFLLALGPLAEHLGRVAAMPAACAAASAAARTTGSTI